MMPSPVILGFLLHSMALGQSPDAVGRISSIIDGTNSHNCSQGFRTELPPNSVSHNPHYIRDSHRVQPSNRTSLQYAYNVAASRAIFLSVIYNWTSTYAEWRRQPGLQYLYLSTGTTVQAGPSGVSSSGLFFGPNKTYANWLAAVPFNFTFPLFGVRANKMADGVGDGRHVLVKDLGLTADTNYTDYRTYPQSGFFESFRHRDGEDQSDTRTLLMNHYTSEQAHTTIPFSVRTMQSSQIAEVVNPYYDCDQTNKWLVSSVALAAERLARYNPWAYLRHFRNVALSSVDVEFESVDINVCPRSQGNEGPNPYAGLAYCPPLNQGMQQKCKVIDGSGFSRTGYVCCRLQDCPNDRSTSREFRDDAETDMNGFYRETNCVDPSTPLTINDRFWSTDDLKVTFEVQAREGLRLALFLSAFLQINDPDLDAKNAEFWENAYSNIRYDDPSPEVDTPLRYVLGDHMLTTKQLFAEVFSLVMADGDVVSAGIFLEPGFVFQKSHPVGAFAWRERTSTVDPLTGFDPEANVVDLYQINRNFTQFQWYTQARARYSALTPSDLTEYGVTEQIRVSVEGHFQLGEQPIVQSYHGEDYDGGQWVGPHFPCDSIQSGWHVSYISPIYGKADDGNGLVFAGVVKVDSRFSLNHIHQSD